MFDKSKVPMHNIHYVALLDEFGETVITAPMEVPFDIPQADKIASITTDIRVNVKVQLDGKASR